MKKDENKDENAVPTRMLQIDERNCYDPDNDVCRMGHSAGCGSPLGKCCRDCNEWGQHPGGIIVIDGEYMRLDWL